MQIKIEEISKSSVWVGKRVWICDFRQPDLNKKPIRHVQPIEVVVCSNEDLPKGKTIYYSENHFRKIGAKGMTKDIIPVFDNTGYRFASGTPVQVFDNPEECYAAYNVMADAIINELDNRMAVVLKQLQAEKNDILKLKMKYS